MCLAGDASQRCGGPVRGHSAYPQGLQMQPRRRGFWRPQGWTQGAIDTVSAEGRLSCALPVHHTPLDLWLRRTNALRRRGRAQPGRDQGRHQHHGERSQQHAGKPAVASRGRHATIVGAPRARQAATGWPADTAAFCPVPRRTSVGHHAPMQFQGAPTKTPTVEWAFCVQQAALFGCARRL